MSFHFKNWSIIVLIAKNSSKNAFVSVTAKCVEILTWAVVSIVQLALEKEELRIHLQASKDAQRQLTAEVESHKTHS